MSDATDRFQLFPALEDTEYLSLKEDIRRHGLLVPIEVDQDGELLDGFHRRRACKELGIEPTVIVRHFETEEARVAHVIALNLKRRHLNESQRAMVAARIANMPQGARTDLSSIGGMSQPDAATLLNVSVKSLERAKAVQEQAEPEVVALVEQGKMAVAAAVKLAKKTPEKQRATAAKVMASKSQGEAKAHVAQATGETEWFTPPEYIEAARLVMGGIDLDPASCAVANRIVQADSFYSKEDDGLAQPWHGRVWMNPPYAQPLVERFTERLVENVNRGGIDQACVLVNNATETGWFQPMLQICSAVCFLRGRVKFLDAEGQASGAPLQGQAVLYFGDNLAGFDEAFKGFGPILGHLNG